MGEVSLSNRDVSNQTYKCSIALAGLFQAATLVEQIANTGSVNEEDFEISIASTLKVDAASIEDIFQGQVNYIPGLALGFKQLYSMLEQNRPPASDSFRYVLGLLHLQKRLQRNKALMAVLGSRLQKTMGNLDHFDVTHERIIASLAHIYEDTLSTFRYRIQVTGNRLYLENPTNVNRIRALLLAGVRSAMLWRQVGGKRWHLLTQRRALLTATKSLM